MCTRPEAYEHYFSVYLSLTYYHGRSLRRQSEAYELVQAAMSAFEDRPWRQSIDCAPSLP